MKTSVDLTGQSQEELLAVMEVIAREINAILPLDSLLERIAELTRQFINYQFFAILLADEDNQRLKFRFVVGDEAVPQRKSLRLGEGLAGAAAIHRQPVLVPDLSKHRGEEGRAEAVGSKLALPLISRNRLVGVLDIECGQAGYFQPHHQRILALLASQLAGAIDNANLYDNLIAKTEILETLHEVGKELSSILDLEQLLKRVGELIRRVLHYSCFSIFVIDERDRRQMSCLSFDSNLTAVKKVDLPLGQGLAGRAIASKKSQRLNHSNQSGELSETLEKSGSAIGVPLIYKEKVIGAFELQSLVPDHFSDLHEQALMTLSNHLAVAIENARLYERVVSAEAHHDRELKFARDIQYSLITDELPRLSGVKFGADFRPARILGGDLYHFFRYEKSRIAIAVGDVSGKGAPAALYAALASGILQTRATRKYSVAEMLRLMNNSLRLRAIEGRFMNLCYALYNAESQLLTCANSGVPPPILCRNAATELLSVTGFPLGMFDDATYEATTVKMEVGDSIIFYTDGLSEARNRQGEDFGTERLRKLAGSHASAGPRELIDRIFSEIQRFSLDRRKSDDQTIVVLQVT